MNELNPLVSIIIPTYNRADLIKETLDSVKAQTYQNWECIIVDDGSTDNSENILKEILNKDGRFEYLERKREPKGAPTCRNIGIEKSRGEYIMFLDSDDLILPTCLERRVVFFKKNKDMDFLVFQSMLFAEKMNDMNLVWNVGSNEDDLERFLRVDALWPICGPFYKREVLFQLNGFREDLQFWQDYDVHLKCLILKYRYKRFLNLDSDCFIRWHFDSSVSRSIPFTENEFYLQKRIDFFHSQLEFVNNQKIKLTALQKNTLTSVLYYFCSCFITEHSNQKQYQINWSKSKQLLGMKNISFFISFLYLEIIHLRRRSKYFIKIGLIYYSLLKKYIPDLSITSKTTMCKKTMSEN